MPYQSEVWPKTEADDEKFVSTETTAEQSICKVAAEDFGINEKYNAEREYAMHVAKGSRAHTLLGSRTIDRIPDFPTDSSETIKDLQGVYEYAAIDRKNFRGEETWVLVETSLDYEK